MGEKCSKMNVTCPHLEEYEIDDVQGCKQACYHPNSQDSEQGGLFPAECPLDVCAELQQAREAQREKDCKAMCKHCADGTPLYEWDKGLHIILRHNEVCTCSHNMYPRCKADAIRQQESTDD